MALPVLKLMQKILSTDELHKIKKVGKTVIIGGCFDILHAGHIEFIKHAKELGDNLIILLESDEKVRKTKGKERPVNKQLVRAKILSTLKDVDYIVCLPYFKSNDEYEKLVIRIQPDIIALTKGTRIYAWEKEFSDRTGAKMIEVMAKKKTYSTTNLLNNYKSI